MIKAKKQSDSEVLLGDFTVEVGRGRLRLCLGAHLMGTAEIGPETAFALRRLADLCDGIAPQPSKPAMRDMFDES